MDHGSQYSIHSICRICLVHLQEDSSYDLFMTPGLAKKLCVCTSLSVEPQDGFPKNLCEVCYTRLNDLHDFQKLCVDSVQKFQDMVATNSFLCVPPVNAIDLPEADLDNGPIIEEDRINFDPLLHHKMEIIENEDEVIKMLEHVDKEDPEDEDILQAVSENKHKIDNKLEDPITIEDKKDKDKEKDKEKSKPKAKGRPVGSGRGRGRGRAKKEETEEEEENEKDDNVDDDDDDEDDDDFSKDNRDDDNFFDNNDGFNDESSEDSDNSEDDKDFAPDGGATSSSDDDKPLALRIRKKQNAKDSKGDGASKPKRKRIPAAERHLHRIIECHICHQKFKKRKNYQEHMKHHNDKLPFQCSVESCQKGFTTASGLRMHVDHAHTELAERHACPEEGCDKVFPRSRLLTWHLRKVHKKSKEMVPPKLHPCSQCEKVFRCPMALKKHMYKHDGKELPFGCNICGKRFVINSALKEHLMRHAGIKNYVCPYCGVGKTTRQEWNNHINMHTQEKKYQCHLCEHSSHNKQALTNHIRVVHEKIKNYACQYCGKTFGKSHACKIHEMTHTGEKRCECKVCGKRFLYPKSLTKHLKTHEKRVLRAIEVYKKRQNEIGDPAVANPPGNNSEDGMPGVSTQAPSAPAGTNMTEEILKACAESVATIPKDTRRVERVDISQLAGTAVNPIPQISLPSWTPQVNFTMKEGKHICPGCGKGFNNIGNMKRHYKIIHEKVKDFACRFCEKRFAKAQTLKYHEMTHTGEKPFECNVCKTRFRQDVALKRHMKVHQKRPPVVTPKMYVAREELEQKERENRERRRRAEIERQAVTEAAREQLMIVKAQIEKDKQLKQNLYERYFDDKEKDGGSGGSGGVSSANGGSSNPNETNQENGNNGSGGANNKKDLPLEPEKYFATFEELELKEKEAYEAKRKAEEERAAIAEAARQQLMQVKAQMEYERNQKHNLYNILYEEKAREQQAVSNNSSEHSQATASTNDNNRTTINDNNAPQGENLTNSTVTSNMTASGHGNGSANAENLDIKPQFETSHPPNPSETAIAQPFSGYQSIATTLSNNSASNNMHATNSDFIHNFHHTP